MSLGLAYWLSRAIGDLPVSQRVGAKDTIGDLTRKRRCLWDRRAKVLRRPTSISVALVATVAGAVLGTIWAWQPGRAQFLLHQGQNLRLVMAPSQMVFVIGVCAYAVFTVVGIVALIVDRLAMREYVERTLIVRLRPPANLFGDVAEKARLLPKLDLAARQLAQIANRVVAATGSNMDQAGRSRQPVKILTRPLQAMPTAALSLSMT